MNEMEKSFLEFCMFNYGGQYTIVDSLLLIKIGRDLFKINLTDKKRFGEYTIYHKSNYNPDGSDKTYFHVQMKVNSMTYALYICFTHDFNKSIGIKYNKEDWQRFRSDANMYREKLTQVL